VQLGILLVLAGLAAWRVDLHEVGKAFGQVRYAWLAVAFLIYVGSRILHTWEWRVLLTKVGEAPFLGLFGVLLIGSLVNAVFPANLGDVAKVQIMANRYGLTRAGLIGSRGAETVLNGVMFVVFVFIGVALAHGSMPQTLVLALAFVSGLLCLGAVLLSQRMGTRPPKWRLLGRLPLRFHRSMRQAWPRIRDGFEALRRPELLATLVLLNLAGWSIEIAMYWAYGRAFNLDLSPGACVAIAVVVSIVTTFPVTFGNIGSWEAGIVAALALYGVPADEALTYAVEAHVFITLFNLGLGLLAMLVMRIEPAEILRLRDKTQPDLTMHDAAVDLG
jgi:glycosyltransferase 2 family protein